MFYLTTVNKMLRRCHSWLERQYLFTFCSVRFLSFSVFVIFVLSSACLNLYCLVLVYI